MNEKPMTPAEIERAVKEACAKVCEKQAKEPECPERAAYCAEAIRALPPMFGDGQTIRVDRDGLIAIINEHVGDAMFCTRAWSAWSYGTMGERDFEPVSDGSSPGDLADAILAKISAAPTAGQAAANGGN